MNKIHINVAMFLRYSEFVGKVPFNSTHHKTLKPLCKSAFVHLKCEAVNEISPNFTKTFLG